MKRVIRPGILFLVFAVTVVTFASAPQKARYIIVLPDAYVGWIQIIFGDNKAAPLPRLDGGFVVEVSDSGIARTSDFRVHSSAAPDEFVYARKDSTVHSRIAIPSDYVLTGVSHGGFGVMDTGGRGKGYSWFIFIGPLELRERMPMGDWDKVVASWRKNHGNERLMAPSPYPLPGRITP